MRHFVNVDHQTSFDTIQEALDQAVSGDVIIIGAGTYNEKLTIKTDAITLMGTGMDQTFIRYSDYAKKEHEDGRSYGTFRTYTMLVEADDICVKNMTIANDAGDGSDVGQAVALYIDGNCVKVEQCRILGHQDTVFIAPLPPSPRIPDSFRGPSEHKDYRLQFSYFDEVIIQGDIDFIFGSGKAVFHHSTIISNNRNESINGYICAPSTWENETYGFVFIGCEFKGEKGIADHSVFLARPWRPYAQAHFFDCHFGPHIHTELVDDWGNKDNRMSVDFGVYGCVFENSTISVDTSFVNVMPSFGYSVITGMLSHWHMTCIT